MRRLLTAARAVVAPADREAYLATMAALARRLEARGQHCWLFERRGAPGEFLEFAEGSDAAGHRAAGPRDADEAALERRLLALAQYDATRDERWDAVPLMPTSREG